MADFELPDQSQPPAAPSDAPPIPPSLLGAALSLASRWKNDWSSGPQDAGGSDVMPLPANPAYDAVADDSTRVTRMKASAALVAFGGQPLAWAGANPDPNIIRVAGGDAAADGGDVQLAQRQEIETSRPPAVIQIHADSEQPQAADLIPAQDALGNSGKLFSKVGYDYVEPFGAPSVDGSTQGDSQKRPATWPGYIVVLPDGSRIPHTSQNSKSPTGYVMSPVADLRPVAAAGRRTGEIYRQLMADPMTSVEAAQFFSLSLGMHVGQGGVFDYQREGNQIIGLLTHFDQRPQFRSVSNFNVGLFCQQAGLTLEETLTIAGRFARLFSKNADPTQPYGLDKENAEFTRLGFKAGQSGMFDSTTSH